jgi:hypothetical protein
VPADLQLLSTLGDVRFNQSILIGELDEIEGVVNYTNDSLLESWNIALIGTIGGRRELRIQFRPKDLDIFLRKLFKTS